MTFLPLKDREYLTARSATYEEFASGSEHAVRLTNWPLPAGKFDVSNTDVLILLPAGYPDVRPDMFYLFPWIRLLTTGQFPRAADQPHSFCGVTWQRWSRHSEEWRSGRDGIWTMIKRIEHALEIAA